MQTVKSDKVLADLVKGLYMRSQAYGTDSKQVVKYIQKHSSVQEFPELAKTALVSLRKEGAPKRIERPFAPGIGPMPTRLPELFRWMFTPNRAAIAVANITALSTTIILATAVHPFIGFVAGATLLWCTERARENALTE